MFEDKSIFPSGRLASIFDGKYECYKEINESSNRSRTVIATKGSARHIVKFLHRDHETTENAIRMRNEFAALGAIGSPSVPRIIENGTQYRHPYFIEEFVAGYTVGDLIEGGFMLRPILRTLRQPGALDNLQKSFSQAISRSHSAGFLHGDIAPGNLLVKTNRSDVIGGCLLDFGECERLGQNAIYVRATGTQGYSDQFKRIGSRILPSHDFDALNRCMADLATSLGVHSVEPIGGLR